MSFKITTISLCTEKQRLQILAVLMSKINTKCREKQTIQVKIQLQVDLVLQLNLKIRFWRD